MSKRRWPLWLGPPVALALVVLALTRFQPAAEAGGRTTPAPAGQCAASPVATDAAGKPKRDAGPGSWWKLADRIDGRGAMIGRQLFVGRGGSISMVADVSVESAASGPIGGVVVVVTDVGRSSEIRLVSAVDACSWLVHTTSDVVRGAIFDPSNGSLITHLVDRDTRADLGTWRFGAGGALGEPERIAPPLPAAAGAGLIFVTDLRLDQVGRRLAVQSCNDTTCLTRVFDLRVPGRNPIALEGDQGAMLGFAGNRLITWAACPGLPCAINSWDLATGESMRVLDFSEAAAVSPDGRFLLASTDAATGRTLRIELASGRRALVKGLAAGEKPLMIGVAASAGMQVAADEVGIGAQGANPRSFRPAAAEVIP